MKKVLILSLIISLAAPCYALEYKDINTVRPPAYRVGLSDQPEKEYVEVKQTAENTGKTKVPDIATVFAKKDEDTKFNVDEITYADLSIKQISKEVAQELQLDEEEMVGDLSLLWQGAATQSECSLLLPACPQLSAQVWGALFLQQALSSAEIY